MEKKKKRKKIAASERCRSLSRKKSSADRRDCAERDSAFSSLLPPFSFLRVGDAEKERREARRARCGNFGSGGDALHIARRTRSRRTKCLCIFHKSGGVRSLGPYLTPAAFRGCALAKCFRNFLGVGRNNRFSPARTKRRPRGKETRNVRVLLRKASSADDETPRTMKDAYAQNP